MSEKDAVDKLKDKLYSRTQAPELSASARTPLSHTTKHTGRVGSDMKIGQGSASAPAEQPPIVGPELPGQPPRPPRPPVPEGPAALSKLSTPPIAMTGYSKRHRSFAARFFWTSLGFFIIASGIAAYTFFGGSNVVSSRNIDIQVVAPSLIDSGKETNLQFIIVNRNSTLLRSVDLIIGYPEGTRAADDLSKALPRERQTIGDINAGQSAKQTARAVFFGAEGSTQRLSVTLEYQIPGSNAIFTKQASSDFTIGSSPVSLAVDAPQEAIAGQPFTMDVTVKSNATTPVLDMSVQGQYPFGYSLSDATPAPSSGGAVWKLGTIDPGETKVIHITGSLDGQDGDQRVFHFLVGSNSDQTNPNLKVPLLSVPQTVTVRKPFLTGAITLDGQTAKTVPEPLGKRIQGSIDWTNNLRESVTDVELSLSIKGQALDTSAVTASNGFYDSANSRIVWTKDQLSELASVPPGATGQVQFSFATLSPSSGVVLTNPDITLNLTVKAVRQAGTSGPSQIQSAASARVTLASMVSFASSASHFGDIFANQGPMPPASGKETGYTIRWTVKNSSNSIADALVSAVLPPYVTYKQAAAGEDVSYDSGTRTVTWKLGELKAGSGYGSAARTAQFQVALVPSLSQVGTSPTLTGQAVFSGSDRYAQARIETSAAAPTIRLAGDSGYTQDMGVVVAQ